MNKIAERQRLKEDWCANAGNTKGRIIVLLFRLCRILEAYGWQARPLYIAFKILYKLVVEWCIGAELPLSGDVGGGLKIFHGQALIVHRDVVLGKNVTLRHSTTIGNKGEGQGVPYIADNVDIGANTVIIGAVFIGSNVRIGAGSIVVDDIPDGCVVRAKKSVYYRK